MFTRSHLWVRLLRASNALSRTLILFCLGGLLLGSWYHHRIFNPSPLASGHAAPQTYGPENVTLGFGAIYVVTESESTWRVQGLQEIANLIGLQFTIPRRKSISDDDVSTYLAGNERSAAFNSTRALLNHVSLLEEFLETNLESALICEDDVDFSLYIKSQMRQLSDAILRAPTSSRQDIKLPGAHQSARPSQTHHPFGKDDWDILWLGHMGVEYTHDTNITAYEDRFALPWTQLTSTFNNYYSSMAETENEDASQPQQFWTGVAPMATFAYAVTRAHAAKMINKIRQERPGAFDTWLHTQCKGGWQTCAAPVPELMHHHRVSGQRALSAADPPDAASQDLDWWKLRHKYTYNIEWSARCNAGRSGDQIGSLWQCLPSKDDQLI